MTKSCIGGMSDCEFIDECYANSPAIYGECARAQIQGRIPKQKPIERLSEVAITEKQFQTNVIAASKLHGWIVYHTHDSRQSEPGFPDLVLLRGKQLKFRELKTDRGRLTADQQRWLEALLAAGADTGVWRPADWDSITKELKEG